MSKVLAVFGATGHQGSSVIANLLGDSELSKEYKIRAITRDVNSDKVRALKAKVEVVAGDANDPASLGKALDGAHAAFIMTTPHFGPDPFEVEYAHGKNMADAAVQKGLKYIIFSTLPPVKSISGGKYNAVFPFDVKAKLEEYIRGLPIKSSFVSMGSFIENFYEAQFLKPQLQPDGTWVFFKHISPKTVFPLVDATGDTGKWVNAILTEPEKYEGKTITCATKLYDQDEVAAALSKASGKTILYKQVSEQEFRDSLPFAADLWVELFSFMEEYGYYGPGMEGSLALGVQSAKGTLTDLEAYVEKHEYRLP